MKTGFQIILTAILILGIVVVINFFFSRHYARIDMTENQDYTLSPPTREILKNIPDVVTLKAYLTEDPVAEALKYKQRVEDLVEEFEAAAGGKILVQYIDPKGDEEEKTEAERYGVIPVQMGVIREDRQETVSTYLGIALLYEDKHESIPAILDSSNLEYELISKIKKLVQYGAKTLPEVGFLGGHGEPSIMFGDYSTVNDAIKGIAHTSTVNPSLPKDSHIDPEKYKVLIVAAPKDLSDRDLYAIDQFLMNQGSIIFLLDPNEVSQQGQAPRVQPQVSNLDGMLAHYGVKANNDMVFDLHRETHTQRVQQQRGRMVYIDFFRMPFFPTAFGPLLSRKNPVTARLDKMIFLFATSLSTVPENLEGKEVMELAWTTEKAWSQVDTFDVSMKKEYPAPPDDQREKKVLALAVQGKFTSYFKDREIPPLLNRATQEPIEDDPLAVRVDETQEPTQILVVGDADFLKNNVVTGVPANGRFILNAVDWLALNPDLVSIRAKGDILRPLRGELSETRRNVFKFVNIFGVPALVALLGLLRLLQRKVARRRYFQNLSAEETRELPAQKG